MIDLDLEGDSNPYRPCRDSCQLVEKLLCNCNAKANEPIINLHKPSNFFSDSFLRRQAIGMAR